MGYRLVLLLFAVVLGVVLGACGKEIGDACINGSDCSPNGDRLCDPSSVDGYCTIQGCDYSTCPDEAACIRFFTGNFENKACDHVCDLLYDPKNQDCPAPVPPAVQCSLDERCSLDDRCVARSSEIRYCMRTCDSDGDCRDGYECRDIDKMIADGGEPVFAPGQVIDALGQVIAVDVKTDDMGVKTVERKVIASHSPKFCAAAPVAP